MDGSGDTAEMTIEAEQPQQRSTPEHGQSDEQPPLGQLHRVRLDNEPVDEGEEGGRAQERRFAPRPAFALLA